MNHTPGPWAKLGTWIHDANGMDIATVEKGFFRVTGPTWTPVPPEYTAEIRESNAHLIAAAPDLLEALEAFVFAVEVDEHCTDTEEDAAIQARAAIARARGEAS